jgi:hypothetical protein
MLDRGDQGRDLVPWIHSLPCEVVLPLKLRDRFEKTGAGPSMPGDARVSCRVSCRGKIHRAALEYAQTFPVLPRLPAWHGVLTTDLSRHGCGFLHSEPLYPGERMQLVLLTGLRRTIEIAWCRRLDERCFAVGAKFIESTASPPSIVSLPSPPWRSEP